MKKILYISGTRADYGLMRNLLFDIKRVFRLEIIATGMHLMPEFGKTVKEIEKDGFRVIKVDARYEKDDRKSIADFIGKFITLLSQKIEKPDAILLIGDRAEMLAGAIVGTYLAIPVIHIHGGEVSATADNPIRHAITQLSNIHFAATKKSAERIIKMRGKDNMFVSGAPGLDRKFTSSKDIFKKYGKPKIIVIQHPVSEEIDKSAKHMKETMEAVKELGYPTIVIYPDADAGGREMIKVIEKYRKYSFIKIFKSIPHEDYLGIMNVSSVMVGNSSGGIIEAASFNLPVVNIGIRQKGRERGLNVTDVSNDKKEIKKAILKAKKRKFKNPYFKKGTNKIIINNIKHEI